MLVTLLIWCFVFIVSISYGQFFINRLSFKNKDLYLTEHPTYIIPVFYLGFIFCAILASLLSLFLPLEWIAASIVFIPAIFLFFKYSLFQKIIRVFKTIVELLNPIPFLISTTILLLFTLWLTTAAINNSDTYIYHAQSIHWIESYPVIVGLGNLFNRLAYNSGWFVQNALFSFSFLGTRSFHVLNGLLIFTISLFFIMEFSQAIKKRKLEMTHFWGLIIVPFGIISIGSQASAPSPDMPVAYLAWLAAYLSLQHQHQKNKLLSIFLISGLLTFAFTIKISVAPLLLMPVSLVLINLKSLRKNVITVLIWMGLILAPWMVRNVIISGYVVYPSAITAVPVKWQIPTNLVKDDAAGIKAFGFNERASQEEVMRKPFVERIKFWFFNLTTNQKMMVLVALFSPIILAMVAIFELRINKQLQSSNIILTVLIFFAGYLFWLSVSPNLRFGYVYIIFLFSFCLAVGVYGFFLLLKSPYRITELVSLIGLSLILIFLFSKSVNLNEVNDRLLLPLDYEHRSTQPCKIDAGKKTIFCAAEYGECGYYAFPCHAWGNENVRMYGQELRDGFYQISPQDK